MKRIVLGLSISVLALVATAVLLLRKKPVPPSPTETLRVIESGPEGLVRSLERLKVVFDRPMIAAEEIGTAADLLHIAPALEGEAIWTQPTTLEFRPSAAPEPGVEYVASVRDGKTLRTLRSWKFRLRGFEVAHLDYRDPCSPIEALKLKFTRPVEPADLRRHARLTTSRGKADFRVVRENDTLLLTPVEPIESGSSLTWSISPELRSGTFRFDEEWSHRSRVCERLVVKEATGHSNASYGNWIRIDFNNRVTKLGALSLNPSVPVKVEYGGSVYLNGEFQPGVTYDLSLAPGTTDEFGTRVATPFQTRVVMPDYEPHAELATSRHVVERNGDPRFPLHFVNIKTAFVTCVEIDPERAIDALVAWKGRIDSLLSFGTLKTERLQVSERSNEIVMIGHRLGHSGLQAIELAAGKDRETILLNVTDLVLTAKLSREETLIAVTRLSTGRPLAEAHVEAYTASGRLIWTGTSDEEGLVRRPAPLLSGLTKARWIIARAEDDLATLDLNDSLHLSRHDVDYDFRRRPSLLGHLFTDRGQYRPGEQVHVRGALRVETDQGLRVPGTRDIDVIIKNARDEIVLERGLTLSEFGTFGLDYALRPRDPLGTWRVTARIGKEESTATFHVEEYRPAPFELKIEGAPEKERLRATLQGRYLFGAPVENANLTWTATLEEEEFSPPGHEGYEFGDVTRTHPRELHVSGKGSLLEVPFASELKGAFRCTVSATAVDASHQAATAERSWTCQSTEFLLGLRRRSLVSRAGEPLTVSVVAAHPDGKPTERRVQLTLLRREWHTVEKKSAGGSVTYVSEPVDEAIETASVTTPCDWSVIPSRAGYYLIRAESDRARSVIEVYGAGPGECGWSLRDDHWLRLVADCASYRPGETASILIASPFEKATAIVTVERDRIYEARVVPIESSAQTLQIPIESSYAPNVFVSVLLLRGRVADTFTKEGHDVGMPAYRIGYATLRIADDSRKIPVAVRPSKAAASPGEEVEVEIRTGDDAEVTVMAVDEAVLALDGYATPDPFECFSRPRPLGVRTCETLTSVMSRSKYDERGRKGKPGGGGGKDEGVSLRGRFVTTAFFATLHCDRVARVRFRLPDNLSRYRVMAIAIGKGDRYGSAEASIETKKPLMLVSALPRFARAGDLFEARVVAHNQTGADGEVEVNFGRETRRVFVKNGQSAAVGFAHRAARTERLRFTARLGSATDGLEIEVPIRPVAPEETAVEVGSSRSGFSRELPPTGRVELAISRSPLMELEGSLDQLLEYPHGCIEQTSSKTLSILTLRPVGGDAGVDSRAQAGVDRILSMQLPSGGFSYWPGGSEPHAFGSVHATHTLVRAKGYDVSDRDRKRALDFISGLLRQEVPLTVKAYALYVLQLAGRPEPSYVNALSLQHPPLAARAFLELAGRPQDLDAPGEERGAMLNSRTIESALRLLARPGDVAFAADLIRHRSNGHWGSTLENAFAILAIFTALHEAEGGAIVVRVKLGDRWLGELGSKTLRVESEIDARLLTIEKEGDGRFYYMIRTRAPSSRTTRVVRGLSLRGQLPDRVKAGELVKLPIRLSLHQESEYVAVEIPIPAGLEVVRATSDHRVERRDDRVLVYIDSARPGLHEITLEARATTPGTFAFPAMRAEEMYRPQFFGQSESRMLVVDP